MKLRSFLLTLAIAFAVLPTRAAEVSEAENKLRTGDYPGVLALAEQALKDKNPDE